MSDVQGPATPHTPTITHRPRHISRSLRLRSSKASAREKVSQHRTKHLDEDEAAEDQSPTISAHTTQVDQRSQTPPSIRFSHQLAPSQPSSSPAAVPSAQLSGFTERSMYTTSAALTARPHQEHLRHLRYSETSDGESISSSSSHVPRRSQSLLPNQSRASVDIVTLPPRSSHSPLSSTASVSSFASSSASPTRPPSFRRGQYHSDGATAEVRRLEQEQQQESEQQQSGGGQLQSHPATTMEAGESPVPEPEISVGTKGSGPVRSASDSITSGSSGSRGSAHGSAIKRAHSEVSVDSDREGKVRGRSGSSSQVYTDDPRSAGIRKQARLEATGEPSSITSPIRGSSYTTDPDRDPRDPRSVTSQQGGSSVERNYVWQAQGAQQPSGSLMSITALSSPTTRHGKDALEGSGGRPPPPILPSPGQLGRFTRAMPSIESRLPGIASLNQRPTSPPPQVSRIHASRSFVAAPTSSGSAGATGMAAAAAGGGAVPPLSSAGHSLGQFTPGHSHHLSLQASPGMSVGGSSGGSGRMGGGHQSFASLGQALSGPSGEPILSLAAVGSGCPPIHPSLIGLPGSGTAPGNKQQPSFVAKLYSMLEDESISKMISWGATGDVFSVSNPAAFSRLVLPTWFKHANWQSFVRQLNMYGFHKVNHTFSGLPNEEVQIWEFKHSFFRRGQVGLLGEIKRKSSRHKRGGSPSQSFSGSIAGVDFGEVGGGGGGATTMGARGRSDSDSIDFESSGPQGMSAAGASGSSLGLSASAAGSGGGGDQYPFYQGVPGGSIGPNPLYAKPGIAGGGGGGWESVDAADHPPPRALLSASRVTSVPARYRSLTDADRKVLQAERALEQVMREGEAMRGEISLRSAVPPAEDGSGQSVVGATVMDRGLGAGSGSTAVSSRFGPPAAHRKSVSMQGGSRSSLEGAPFSTSSASRLLQQADLGGKQWATSSGVVEGEPPAPAPAPAPMYGAASSSYLTLRLEDLADRVDSIIRHSDYLEGQVRTLSQELVQSHERESTNKRWTLRVFHRLVTLVESAPQGSAEGGDGGSARRRLLDLCRSELAQLAEGPRVDMGTLSSPSDHAPQQLQQQGIGPHRDVRAPPSSVTPTARRHFNAFSSSGSTGGGGGGAAAGAAAGAAGGFHLGPSSLAAANPAQQQQQQQQRSQAYTPRNPNLPGSSPMVRSGATTGVGMGETNMTLVSPLQESPSSRRSIAAAAAAAAGGGGNDGGAAGPSSSPSRYSQGQGQMQAQMSPRSSLEEGSGRDQSQGQGQGQGQGQTLGGGAWSFPPRR